jgi:hypothetical protein
LLTICKRFVSQGIVNGIARRIPARHSFFLRRVSLVSDRNLIQVKMFSGVHVVCGYLFENESIVFVIVGEYYLFEVE